MLEQEQKHQISEVHAGPDSSGSSITSFDELAKGLAGGTISRRQALRWMGGALVGATVASVPGVAWAAPGGNSACAHFCNQLPPGPERGKCTSEAARNVPNNLCEQCGADPARICPEPTTPDQLRCCPEGRVCCGTTACCTQFENCCPSQNRCVNCGTDRVFNPANGQCECRPGTEACRGFCRPLCPPGSQRDPQSCLCGRFCGSTFCPLGTTCCSLGGGSGTCCPEGATCCRNQSPFQLFCCPPGRQCVRNPFTGIVTCQ
jgi:hypothetical protein